MNGCLLFRPFLLLLTMAPCFSNGQNNGYVVPVTLNGEVKPVNSNVRLNEINIHAYRHFQRLFPTGSGEYWYKSADGYLVSFTNGGHHCQAHFDLRGAYLYSLKYCGGEEVTREVSELIRKKYPDYSINVITEITDGEKTFFLVKILNASFVKTLSVYDGRMDLIEELTNGGVNYLTKAGAR